MGDLTTLVTSAQAGNDRAFCGLARRFQAMAYGYAYAILSDLHLTQDAAQEAFLEAYRCLPGLEHPEAFTACLIDLAALRGESTPPELARAVEEEGVEAIDSYGKWGWYFVAREAAATGDVPRAFEALRRALNWWISPPLLDVRTWEDDAYWGDLREHPEYRSIYAEKRERIGAVYDQLWYFPGW